MAFPPPYLFRIILGLREPDIAHVASNLSGLESLNNVLGDTDSSSSGVDEPGTILHVGNELLVEEALGGGVQRTVDGDNVTEREHLLERLHSSTANLLLDISGHGLVVVVEHLHGVEGLASLEYSLTNSSLQLYQ